MNSRLAALKRSHSLLRRKLDQRMLRRGVTQVLQRSRFRIAAGMHADIDAGQSRYQKGARDSFLTGRRGHLD